MDLLDARGRRLYAYTGARPWATAGSPGSDSPCAVLIHGALNDHSVWTLPARWLAHHGWRVLALDLPGHGRSEGPLDADVGALAETVLALLDRLGVRDAALIGHSMGSLVALEATARSLSRPVCVRHLVMVGTAVPMPVSTALLDAAVHEPMRAIDLVVSLAHASLAAKPGNPGPGTWHHGASRQLMRRVFERAQGVPGCEHNIFHHDFSVCNGYADGMAAAERVRANADVRPSVIVAGRDRMTPPRSARAVAQALGARWFALPTAGHELMQEDPEGLLAALRQALD